MWKFDYQFRLLKNRIAKYKYIIFLCIIIISSIIYYIFFREIRNIDFYGTSLQINDKTIKTDIWYDYYIRSKQSIINIDFSYWYDFEIDGTIKNKQNYEKFIKDFKINKSFSCTSQKICNFKWKENNLFLDMIDSLYSFSKINPDIYIQNKELNQKLINSVQLKDPRNDTTSNNNNNELNQKQQPNNGLSFNNPNWFSSWSVKIIPNLQPSDGPNFNDTNNNSPDFQNNNNLVQNNINQQRNIPSNIPGANPLVDIQIDENTTWNIWASWSLDIPEKIIDCKKIENKNHPKCYKTPKINIKLKGIWVYYNIVFNIWKAEKGKIYKPLTESYIKILGD